MVVKTFVYVLCLMALSAAAVLGLIRYRKPGGIVWLPLVAMQASLFLFLVSLGLRSLGFEAEILRDALGFAGSLGTVVSVYALLHLSLRMPRLRVLTFIYSGGLAILVVAYILWLFGNQAIVLVALVIQFGALIHLLVAVRLGPRACEDLLLGKILGDALYIALPALPFLILDSVGSLLGFVKPAILFDDYALPVFFLVLHARIAYRLVRWLGEAEIGETDELINWDAFGLSAREKTVASLLREGKSAKDISNALGLAPKTAENHVYRIFKKLGVGSRFEFLSRFGPKR